MPDENKRPKATRDPKSFFRAVFRRGNALLDTVNSNLGDRWMLIHLATISAILFLVPIFFIHIYGGDEPRVAGIAAEMAIENDWLTPRLNGTPFLEYPPLFYAATASCFRIFGITPFAAKLPTALSAGAGVLIFYCMMRILRRSKCESFAGAFMLATGLHYLTNAYDCRVDMMLTTFCIIIWTGFAMMEFSGEGAGRRMAGMLVLGFGIAGAVLTKNLTGAGITLPGIACAMLLCDLAKRRFSFAGYCRLAGAVVLGMVPYMLYLWLLYRKNGVEAVETIFLHNNFGRFSGSVADHCYPWYGYVESLYEYFPPYMPLMLCGMFLQLRECRKRRSEYGILSLTLLVVPFILLSAASSKRQVYLLPLSAPSAMLAAATLPYVMGLVRKLSGRAATLLLCRRLKTVVYTVTVLFASIVGTAISLISSGKTFAPVFAEAERIRQGRRLVLMTPLERHSGAVVFYTRATAPEIGKWDEFKTDDIALAPSRSNAAKQIPPGCSVRLFEDAKLIIVSYEK